MIGLWIRISVEESPVFLEAQKKAQEQAAAGVKEQPPVVEVFRKSWARCSSPSAPASARTSTYILTAFLLVYVTVHLEMSSDALNAVLIGSAVHFVTIPLWGALSDRIGRRPVTLIGALGMAVWAFGFFALLDTKSFPVIVLSVTVGLLLHGAMYGPQAAFISEMFDTKVRYSGASMGSSSPRSSAARSPRSSRSNCSRTTARPSRSPSTSASPPGHRGDGVDREGDPGPRPDQERIGRLLGPDWNEPPRTLEIQLALRLHRLTQGL
ncbi:hypothetical protein SMICM17S_11612 [Streptomyces microflavus]